MKQKEEDQIQDMRERYGYKCFLCEKVSTQRAHIIGNTKPNRKKYGPHIIDNPLNWLPACDLDHNALIDIGNRTDIIAALIQAGDRIAIEFVVMNNVERKRGKVI